MTFAKNCLFITYVGCLNQTECKYTFLEKLSLTVFCMPNYKYNTREAKTRKQFYIKILVREVIKSVFD